MRAKGGTIPSSLRAEFIAIPPRPSTGPQLFGEKKWEEVGGMGESPQWQQCV